MNEKEEAASNVHWLYRYIFRGVGWVAVAGVLTWLYLVFRGIYRPRHGRNITTRYFVDKFPLFLSGASSAPSPVVGFVYVDGSREAFGVRYLPAAVQRLIQSARPFWDHLYGWG